MSEIVKGTAIEALSANILDTRFEDLDRVTVENAKERIIDVVGCAVGGANGPGNTALLEMLKEWGGARQATVLVHGGKFPAGHAAMLNSIMARSYDFEVMSPLIDGVTVPAHITGTTAMTAIAMAETRGAGGRELIAALVAGEDAASRILASSGPGFTLGWDSVGTVNMIGAAVIAGRFLGLNRLQMRNAFGLVLNQLAGSFQSIWDGTTAFKLHQGISARNGIFTAELAKGGWTGPRDALLSRFGYYNLYTDGCSNEELLTKDLGKKYYAEATFKAYPCCRATHGLLDCALEIMEKEGINAEEIKEVTLFVPRSGLDNFIGQPFVIRDFPQGDAVFNYQYTVANALLRRCVKPEHFSEEAIRDQGIVRLIDRIKLSELEAKQRVKAEVRIEMKDGRQLSASTNAPKGDPMGNPMSDEEIEAKFMANLDFSGKISRTNGDELLGLLHKLEELPDMGSIIELLTT